MLVQLAVVAVYLGLEGGELLVLGDWQPVLPSELGVRHALLSGSFDLGVLQLLGQRRLEQTHLLLVAACVGDEFVSGFVGDDRPEYAVEQSCLSLKTKDALVDELCLILVEGCDGDSFYKLSKASFT